MKWVAPFVVVAMLASAAHAEPCPKAFQAIAGTVLKCDGTLVPDSVVRRLLSDSDALAQAKVDMQRQADLAQIDKDELRQKLVASEKARTACETEKSPVHEGPGFFEHPVVTFIGGLVLGAGIAAVAVYLAKK